MQLQFWQPPTSVKMSHSYLHVSYIYIKILSEKQTCHKKDVNIFGGEISMLTFNSLFKNYSKPTTTVEKDKVNYFELSVTHGVEATGKPFAFALPMFSMC